MRRRPGTGGKPVKARRRKTVTLKRRNAPKVTRTRPSSVGGKDKKIALLTRERDEALEQQAATADVLKVISRSTFDLQTVLNTLVKSAARLCEAYDAVILLRQNERLHVKAHHGPIPVDFGDWPIGRGWVTGRAFVDRTPVHVYDLQACTQEFPDGSGMALRLGHRTILAVPLQSRDEAIGAIAIRRTEVRPFTDKQIELVETFADQAVVAIENARLLNELRQALEQQTATSAVLGIISRSPGQLDPVFKAILENAARICQAQFGTLNIYDGSAFRSVALHNPPPQYAMRLGAVIRPHPESGLGYVARTKQIAHIDDIRTRQPYLEGDKAVVGLADLAGARTLLIVPMLKEDKLIGTIAIYRQEVRPFTDKQIALLQNFAAQAVIAIENTGLLNELRESLQQQTATSEVLKVISSSPGDLQPVFESLLRNATQLCKAKFGTLYLREEGGVRLVAAYDMPAKFYEVQSRAATQPAPGGPLEGALKTKRAVQIPDLAATEVYRQRHPRAVDAVELGRIRTAVAVPMLKDDEPIGVISIHRPEVALFDEKQIALLTSFAAQAVIAIENARLLNELRKSLQQQTATADVLKVISRSTFDLQGVLDTLVESAARLCEADRANLWRPSGDVYRIAAGFALSPEHEEALRRHSIRPGRYSCVGRVLLEGKAVHITDAQSDPEYNQADVLNIGVTRTMLGVPLLREGIPIGVLVVTRSAVRPFTEKQIELIETFADQAVIAIENARLFEAEQERSRELSQALEQQTATSEVLQVISSSPGDLEPVFETMLAKAVRICDARFGNIFRWDGDALHLLAAHNVPIAFDDVRRRLPLRPSPGPLGRMVATKTVVHVTDLAGEKSYIERAPSVVAAVELGGIRTFLAVPMLKEGELIGAFTLNRPEVRPFTEKEIALVTSFAAQAVIAIENARLLSELRQRTDELGRSVGELRALGEVSQAVNSTLDIETVLSTIVAKAVQLSGTDAGAIYVFDELEREFRLRATYGMDQELIDALRQQHIGMDEPNVERAFAEGEPIQVADLREDAPSPANEIVLRAGYRARLAAPLMRGEEIVGMLVVRRRTPGAFPPNIVDLMKTFAAQSALAIENARLFNNVETSLKDLRTAQDRLVQTEKLASLGQLTAGIAHEIKNPLNFVNNFSAVSVELIDELREALGGVHLDSKLRAEISDIADTLQGNLDKVVQHGKRADAIVKNMLLHSRQGSGEHRPVDINALVDESLNLAYHGARAEKQGFTITLERSFDPAAGEADLFPQEITRALLNLISNGFYAATKRKVDANGGDYEPTLVAATKNLGDRVEIRIRDNGTGITPEVKEKLFSPFFTTKPAGEGTGLGLSISHDIIVKQHGGSIEVETQPGAFTEFRIVLPRAGAALIKSGERA